VLSHLQTLLDEVRGAADSGPELQRATVVVAEALLTRVSALRTRDELAHEHMLGRLMHDQVGQTFTTCLTDRVYRSADPSLIVDVARQLLRRLGVPRYLPASGRAQLQLLLRAGPFVPRMAADGMLRRLREETRSVVFSAQEPALSQHLQLRRSQGVQVNLNYLGEAVLGEDEAAARCASYEALLARPDVYSISVKLSSIASRIEPLAFRETLDLLKPRLRRIYRCALDNRYARPDGSSVAKLVTLDMEAYRDLDLTFALFSELLDEPELRPLQAGLVLQAYLPDSFEYQRALTHWARARVERGGAPARLRIVKGANLAAESVESSLRGWQLPIFDGKPDVDANYKRMLEYACQPERARALHIGIASHNLFDVAFGLVLRASHGVAREVSFELLEGMADPLRRTLQSVTDQVLLYCPIVEPGSMQTAIAYLMRRLDENTAPENFLRNSFGMHLGDASWQQERERFEQAFVGRHELPSAARRRQDRGREVDPRAARIVAVSAERNAGPFGNEPDTDFTFAANRRFILDRIERLRTRETFEVAMQIGGEHVLRAPLHDGFDPSRPELCPYRHPLATGEELERALQTASDAARRFATSSVAERAALLQRVAQGLRRGRGELIAVMLLDAGKRADQADAEVSEAIDFAEYYAANFLEHAQRPELALTPKGVVLVTPPWNFPLAIPASGTLAALMAGNAVILKPALETVLVAERFADVCFRAGVPKDVLQLVFCEDELGSRLIRDTRVASVVLTGATATAQLFRSLRPGLDLLAETGGKNAVIVSALADRDLAIQEVLASAFGHAGQKCSAASLLICVPDVYDDPKFMEVLRDASASLVVGSAWDARSFVTPLIAPPKPSMTELAPGEHWLVEPRLDAHNPRLLGPGVKLGVAAGSFSHVTEFFGPVLSVLRADDFEHAIKLANATPYGLTAGLFSLDEREQHQWAERVQAGNLYLNRTITGAVVRRQPFGGWKASSFGPGAKAGGPNYVLQLCHVQDRVESDEVGAPQPRAAALIAAVRNRVDVATKERLARAACHYAHVQRQHFARSHDPSQVLGERNDFRYRACTGVVVRCAADAPLEAALLALLASLSAGATAVLSLHPECARAAPWLERLPGCTARVETAEQLAARLDASIERVRQIGSSESALLTAADAHMLHVAHEPVLRAGRIELLHYVREQVLCNAYHRYGSLRQAQLLEPQAYEPGD
jgi:RHH-type transcriptional regulator, proline utilization regulon repressor / proline dehydrogenase / delta 1-pyrroline-5-carboxylate dehydrogenase